MPNKPVEVIFATTDKRTNSTLKVEGGVSLDCYIKDNSSIIEPQLLIRVDDPSELFKWNYFTIPDYGRSYFITDITHETSRDWWITGQIDVLGTYREQVLDTDAFVMYAASRYDTMLPDERIKISDRSVLSAVEMEASFMDETGCFILTVMSKTSDGTTGPAQCFACTYEQMKHISETLNNDSWLQQVLELIKGDPFDSIVSCSWLPCKLPLISTEASIIEPFGFPLGNGYKAREYISGMMTIEPNIPYEYEYWDIISQTYKKGWADFRNVEPYTEYLLWLPGCGVNQIPMVNLIGQGNERPKFNLTWQVSIPTGEVHYSIHRVNSIQGSIFTNTGDKVLDVKGNLSVSIPVSSRSGGFITGLQHAVGAGISAGLAYMTAGTSDIASIGYTASAIEGALSATKNMQQHNTTVEGNLGGWLLDEEELTRITCMTRQFITSDEPSRIGETVGRPLFRMCRLGELSGIVRCSGAYVKAEGASKFEQEQLSQLINSSTNFIYGGVIIE